MLDTRCTTVTINWRPAGQICDKHSHPARAVALAELLVRSPPTRFLQRLVSNVQYRSPTERQQLRDSSLCTA